MQKFLSHSQFQTEEIAERLAKTLHGTEVIAMFGGMGAGKTASSPTFALVHEYEGRFPLYHFDMYRIGSFDDLYSTGFFDYIENGVMLIEWSENIEPFLPENRISITINVLSEQEREITMEGAAEI